MNASSIWTIFLLQNIPVSRDEISCRQEHHVSWDNFLTGDALRFPFPYYLAAQRNFFRKWATALVARYSWAMLRSILANTTSKITVASS